MTQPKPLITRAQVEDAVRFAVAQTGDEWKNLSWFFKNSPKKIPPQLKPHLKGPSLHV